MGRFGMEQVEQHRRPLWLGLVITPWVTPLIFFLIFSCSLLLTHTQGQGSDWLGFLAYDYLIGVPTGYVAMYALGMPLIFKLKRMKRLTAGYVCVGATVIGAAISPLVVWLISNPNKAPILGVPVLFGSGLGLISGVVFCSIAGVMLRRSKSLNQ